MYFEFTIGFLLVAHVFETWLDIRQHRRLSNHNLPPELIGVVTKDEFIGTQKYGHAKSLFGFFTSTFGLIETMLVLCLGGIPWLWGYSARLVHVYGATYGLSEANTIVVSLVFVVLSVLYSNIVHLPEGIYRTFVLEERFGFNKTTPATFATDKVKSLCLIFVIGLPVIAGALYIITWGGPNFYIYIWLFLTAVTLGFIAIKPWIDGWCYNTYTELEEGELFDAVNKLCGRPEIAFPSRKIYIVDGSKRSSHSNAYFYGFFGTKRIVIFDTLMNDMDTTGIIAVLGHELGHYAYNHVLKNFVVGQVYLLTYFWLFSQLVFNPDIYTSFGIDVATVGTPPLLGLILFAMVSNPFDAVVSFFMHALSRRFEYQADEFATKLGFDLREPLITLHKENKGNLDPDWLYSMYHNSHPTLIERLRYIKLLMRKKR